MKKFINSTIFFALFASNIYAQSDSLELFRAPSKIRSSNDGGMSSKGNNSLSISIGHLGRGGTILTYERFINNSSFAILGGFGFTKSDFIGHYSFSYEENIFGDEIAVKSAGDMGKMFELGIKYLPNAELGGSYMGAMYSSYQNNVIMKIGSSYEVYPSGPSKFNLDYYSREVKFIYGIVNDVTSRFYSDFYLGTGFRFLEYQNLIVQEIGNPYGLYNQNNAFSKLVSTTIISESEAKLWLFIGWKIGLRF